MRMWWTSVGAAVLMTGACTLADGQQNGRAAAPTLPTPEVVMEADPAPPFTYWAAEGSTIRNHGRQAGVWVAQLPGQTDRYSFGDRCQASRYQQFVGRPVAEMPASPGAAEWRTHCTTCAVTQNLAWTRMNISFNDRTGTIEAIACG